ncbi:hypothetical protein GRF59_26570 [Paenibacillus sp. HJL G12]|uniref:Transposase n=2 Tax=Paenibacillus dendrobii TaxID=2691084 RepID=A0A7X3INF3_9BACL|nr:hypothetical protein [Paenibacillus dendrobii]
MNHKKVLRLMQKLGLQASIRRKRRFNMTYQAAERVADHLLKRNCSLKHSPSKKT